MGLCAGKGFILPDSQDRAHHQPDGSGNTIAIAVQFSLTGDQHVILITQQPLNQLIERGCRNAALFHQWLETNQIRVTRLPRYQLIMDAMQSSRTICNIAISQIIQQAAECIEPRCLMPRAGTEKAPRPVERLAPFSEGCFGIAVLGCFHFNLPPGKVSPWPLFRLHQTVARLPPPGPQPP